jgi:hypothetical protein
MATILVVSAPFDPPTRYGYHWLKRFSRFAAKQGHRVIFLSTVNLETFRDALQRYDPKLVVLNGHGGSKSLEVDDTVILGVVDYDPELGKKIYRQNPEWLAGRLVYLATCHTGKELAFRLVDYGAVAVCAFRNAFIFLSEENVSPDRDELAKPFFISMLQFPLHLAAGKTVGFATNATRKAFRYYLEKAEAEDQEEQAKFLNHDLVNFIAIGDLGACL